ncbi:MAG: DNA polymerase III subunit delta' [Rubricoccaceae bacterium]
MPWDRVIGQTRPTETLARALASGRVAHAYLFHGPEGVGKRAAALAFAQALLCERRGTASAPEDDACGSCLTCTRVARLLHPDVHLALPYPKVSKRADKDDRPTDYPDRLQRIAQNPYAPIDYRHLAKLDAEGPSNKQVAHRKIPIETFVQRPIQFKPVEGRRVVVMMPDAERMNDRSANLLLKALEEPGPDAVLILTAERVDDVLPTILSRCQRVRFDPLPSSQIEAALQAREGIEAERAAFVARMADGSYMRALELVKSPTLMAHRQLALEYVRAAYTMRPDKIAPLAEQAAKLGRETLKGWLGLVAVWVRDLVLAQAGVPEALVNVDQAEAVHKFVEALPMADLGAMSERVEEAADLVEANANPTLTLTTLAYALADAMRGQSQGRLFAPLDARA